MPTHTQPTYQDHSGMEQYQHAPAHIYQQKNARTNLPAQRPIDTTSIFHSGITPSSVVKGITGAGDDPLAKYRVQKVEKDDVDWHQTIRSASRANVEGESDPLKLYTGQPPAYVVNTVPAQSPNIRYNPKGTPQSTPHNVHKNVNVVPDPTIKPSLLKEQGDYLEKYRVKSDPSINVGADTEPIRPTVLKNSGGDDYLSKYRVRSPEEEERTWDIQLRNIPATSGKIVELQVEERQLFAGSGAGTGGVISSNFSTLASSTSSNFVLKIGAINFNLTRSLEIGKGRFVRFALEQGQIKFRQQKTPIDD